MSDRSEGFKIEISPGREIIKWTRRALYISFLISITVHIIPLLTKIEIPEKEIEIKRKPISVKFIQPAPRLVKPMELIKKPRIVTRTFMRRTPRTKFMRPRSMRTASTRGATVLASLAGPKGYVDRGLTMLPEKIDLGPKIQVGEILSAKESSVKSLSEELLEVSNLDYGRYSSYAIQNPLNKKDIKGFIKLALIKYNTRYTDYSGDADWNTSPQALANIADFLNRSTGISAEYQGIYTLDSNEIIKKKIPLIFIQGHYPFEYTEVEAENLGRYLRDGGFLLIDDSMFLIGGPFDRIARQLVKDALGEDTVFERLPNTHRIYHSYFDFDGPPPGDDMVSTWLRPSGERTIYDFLEGVYIGGRLAVLISNRSYNNAWNFDYHWRPGTRGPGRNNTRQLQFAVNIVVFVLTQPGGYTQQVVAYK